MTSRRSSGPGGRDAQEALAVTTPVASGVTTSPAATPTFARGTVLADRYVVLRFVAAGGMGEVYEVEDRHLNERVALKTIRREVATAPQVVERFRREIQLARKVTHPNVCRVFDVGVHEDADAAPVTFLTMELLEGEPLSQLLARRGRLTAVEAAPLLAQMAAGLDAAHAAGIIHRDLKAQNVVLVADGEGTRAVITDFGLARANDPRSSDETLGLTGPVVLGSPAYMAPEQVTGAPVSPATDVYALGIVAFEMLTGTLPFVGETLLATAAQRLERDPPEARSRATGVPPRWNRAILRAMAREPSRRFASAREMLAAISGPPRARLLPWVTIGALLVIAGTAFLLLRPTHDRAAPPAATQDAGEAVALAPTGSAEERALAYLEREETATARGILEQALAENPRDTHLRILLIHVLLAQDATTRAAAEIQRATVDATAVSARDQYLLAAARAANDGGGAAVVDALRMASAAQPDLFVGTQLVSALADNEQYADAEAALAAVRQLPGIEADRPILAILAGQIADLQSRYAEARQHYDAAIAAARSRHWPMVAARALRARGWVNAFLGDLAEAGRDGEDALATYDASGEHLRTGAVLNLLAIVYFYRGEYARCLDRLERGDEVARQIGDPDDHEFFVVNRALILTHTGKLDEAARILNDLVARPDARMRDVAILFAGLVAVRQGNAAKAQPLLAQTSGESRDKLLATWALRGLAEAALLDGNVPEARRQVESCIERGAEIGFAPGLWPCRALLAEVMLAEGHGDLAAPQARQAADELERIGAPDEAAWARVTLVRVLRSARDPGAAEALERALPRAEVTEDPAVRIAIQIEAAIQDADAQGLVTLAAEARELGLGALANRAVANQ